MSDVWKVDTIFVPGSGWGSFTSLENATALNWKIYLDNGGLPAGDPSGGGAPPVWSLTLPPSSPYVTLADGYGGELSNTYLQLPIPLRLPAGHYWLVFYPTLAYDLFGQFGLHPADSTNGEVAKFINPGNGFGLGTEWVDWTEIGVTLHDFAFSIGGSSGYFWKSIDAINSVGRSRPAAATVGGKIYLFGGETPGGGRTDSVERYDPSMNTWTTLAGAMPDPASNICAAVIGTDIYIPGGFSATYTYFDTLRVFHTASNTWSVISTDPVPLTLYGMGCTAVNNKLILFGGDHNNSAQASAYLYDPAAPAGSRWSTLASRNVADSFLSAVTINGKVYSQGGFLCPNCFEVYDPADGMWHIATSLTGLRSGGGLYAVGTTLYACGGGWTTYLDSCESYDTSQGYSGVWKAHPAIMIQARRTFGYASIGPVLYAIAGWNGSYLTTAERWSFDAYLPVTIK